jgi:hemoglobin/transferrin/lactoferrin receptor protein
VVVTATGFEQPLLETPYSVHRVDARDRLERGHRTVPEALRDTPGVMIQKTAQGHGSPFIRGFTGRHNLVLIDGIRFNNSVFRDGPVQYWNTVDSYSIESMELIKSQGSVRYGSDAIGGTLNLITKAAQFRDEAPGQVFDHGALLYRFDTNGSSHTGRLETGFGVGGTFGLHVGVTRRDFGDIRDKELGTMPHTGYDETDYDLRLDYALAERHTVTLAHQRLEQNDIWRTHRTIHFEPWHGTTLSSPDLARIYDQERTLTYLSIKGEGLGDWLQNYGFTVSYQASSEDFNRTRTRSGNTTEVQLDDTEVDTLGVALALDSRVGPGSLIYGFDYYRDAIDSRTRVRTFDASGALLSDVTSVQGPVGDDATYDLVGLFAHYLVAATDDLELTLGGRYTYAEADIGRLDDGAGNPIRASRDWDKLTFELRATYALTEDWRLYGGISQAFRAPNVDDLSALKSSRTDVIATGSLNVAPEEFLTYEVGTRHQGRDIGVHAAVFYTQIRDMITARPIGVDPATNEVITATTNGADGYLVGGELEAAWRLNRHWKVSGFAAYVDGEADTFPTNSLVAVREPVSRLLPLTGSLALRWEGWEDSGCWIEGRVIAAGRSDRLTTSDKADTSRIPPGGTPGYAVVHLDSGCRVTDHLELTLAIHNATDIDYRVHGSGVNEPGINLVLGGRLSW